MPPYTTSVPDTVEGIRSSTLLGSLPTDDLAEVLGICRGTEVARGEQLLRQGDDVATLVLSGVAAAEVSGPEGQSAIVALVGPSSVWGLSVTLGHPRASTDLYALCDLEALLFTGCDLRRLVTDRPAVARSCLRTVASELARVRDEAAVFASTSTTQRVVHRLIELADRWGMPLDATGTQVLVSLPLTQQQLASWSQASRESTAKVLQTLRDTGIVTTGRRRIIIRDLPRLRARHERVPSDPIRQRLLRSIG